MTDCPDGLIRDLLPDYALGALGAEEAARVAAHVAACEACRMELALLGDARTVLGAAAPTIDVAAIVRALPAPPTARPVMTSAAERARRRWFSGSMVPMAAAAGLVLAVVGGVLYSRAPVETVAVVADSALAPVVAESTIAMRASDDGITFGGGLSDLTVGELQKLMGQVDSVRTLPSVDPEAVTPVIALNEGGKGL